MILQPPVSTRTEPLFPYTSLFRSQRPTQLKPLLIPFHSGCLLHRALSLLLPTQPIFVQRNLRVVVPSRLVDRPRPCAPVILIRVQWITRKCRVHDPLRTYQIEIPVPLAEQFAAPLPENEVTQFLPAAAAVWRGFRPVAYHVERRDGFVVAR